MIKNYFKIMWSNDTALDMTVSSYPMGATLKKDYPLEEEMELS